MSTATVEQIIDLIERLPDAERLALEKRLADVLERQWDDIIAENRTLAAERNVNDDAIQAAIRRRRNYS